MAISRIKRCRFTKVVSYLKRALWQDSVSIHAMITIRTAKPSDIPQLVELLKELFIEARGIYTPSQRSGRNGMSGIAPRVE